MRPIDADAIAHKLEGKFNQDMVRYAPILDYKDLVPQGEWVDCRGGDATCSRCGIRQKAVYDDDNEQLFCGHCGARMRGADT